MLSYGISGSEQKDKNRKLSRKLKKTTGLKGQNADTAQNTFGSVQNSLPAYRVALMNSKNTKQNAIGKYFKKQVPLSGSTYQNTECKHKRKVTALTV